MEAKNISNTEGEAEHQSIDVDGSGNIFVVWDDDTEGRHQVYFTRSLDVGESFENAKNISNTTGGTYRPIIAIDKPIDTTYAVWSDSSPGRMQIYFAKSTDGGETFTTPRNVSNTENDAFRPHIAMDELHDIYVVWVQSVKDPAEFQIYFAKSTDGGETFTRAKNISNTDEWAELPRVAVDSRGQLFVVWDSTTDDRPFGYGQVYLVRSADGGETFTRAKNISNNSEHNKFPFIDINVDDVICVLWDHDYFNSGQIYFTRSDDEGETFTEPRDISQTSGQTYRSHIISDSRGNLLIVWSDDRLGENQIFFMSSRDRGDTFVDRRNISNTRGSAIRPYIAVDNAARAYVAWDDNTLGRRQIFFTRSVRRVTQR